MKNPVWLIVTDKAAETAKAMKLVTDSNWGAAWLPKSQIEFYSTSPWGMICRMPYWLYRKNFNGVRYGTDEDVMPHLVSAA